VTPNELYIAMAMLIEEVAGPKYDRRLGTDQPIAQAQWDELDRRWRMIYLMNRSRETSDEQL
jgi:hypothetical protein